MATLKTINIIHNNAHFQINHNQVESQINFLFLRYVNQLKYPMSNRKLVSILRQSLVVCQNPLKKYLLTQSSSGIYCLPVFQSVIGETFKQGLIKGAQKMNIKLSLQGIFRVETGNNGQHSFYRCILYATTDQINQDSSLTFKTYQELPQIGLKEYQLNLIRQIQEAKIVHSLDFFRENHIQDLPIDSKRNIIVDI